MRIRSIQLDMVSAEGRAYAFGNVAVPVCCCMCCTDTGGL